ncbi:AGE family epimerase/isomerase [Caulobacter segnis]|uniref:Mannose-6-phosphate isomerase n=1 Tax=Caulobacter segnis TaxID=88688 RepID=A0A2W5VJH0_9CAUL|nr:AGE family epimerase/isomerase [Caulobacter segnis]PZR35465.1 MAG: mannose-6-phosphate isomerase [Caulobacter segnis]
MSPPEDHARAQAGFNRLRTWLLEEAAPLWSTAGVDADGLFEELIGLDGRPVSAPRRARVQPRQLYALTVARRLGASIDQALLQRGLRAFLARYVRSDGLVRTLIDADGRVLDDRAALYDQAFVLLALANLRALVGPPAEASAIALREAIFTAFRHADAGFWSMDPPPAELLSNPHMHLLEACLAWMEAGGDPQWAQAAEAIVRLALDRFIDPMCGGALKEFFADGWAPAMGQPGRVVEPGHQFEWAWLLLRWSRLASGRPHVLAARVAAMRLIRIGEERGVDPVRNVALNGLLDDFSRFDGEARLWPQTERIKAWALAASQVGGPWWDTVAMAIEGLELYLQTSTPGLWFDRMTVGGALVEAPAPASSFYHIVCAIETLGHALDEAARDGDEASSGPRALPIQRTA